MTSRDFCYWLQGALELCGVTEGFTQEQVWLIQKHLALVFVHEIDPSAGGPEKQAALNEVHGAPPSAVPEHGHEPPSSVPKPGPHLFRC